MQNNVKKTQVYSVAVSLCTCKRPKLLKKALASIEKINIPENLKIEILVVDNDVEKSAEQIVLEHQKCSNYVIHYSVEPKRGLSYARNKVLAEAAKLGVSHILFFDDDEQLDINCLKSHVDFYNENENAYVVSGPVVNTFLADIPNYVKKNIVFKSNTSKQHKQIRQTCATGNVFFPLSVFTEYGIKFSEEYVFMGGEDGDFFNQVSKLGFTIVWNSNAIIYEEIPQARTTIGYLMKKCYYNGYAGAFARTKKKKNIAYVLKNSLLLFVNCLLLLPCLFLGKTVFFNMLGICFRTKGKIDGSIKSVPYNFYENIYGE